jgi:hypothetical protein
MKTVQKIAKSDTTFVGFWQNWQVFETKQIASICSRILRPKIKSMTPVPRKNGFVRRLYFCSAVLGTRNWVHAHIAFFFVFLILSQEKAVAETSNFCLFHSQPVKAKHFDKIRSLG